jgi:hypothetical protein
MLVMSIENVPPVSSVTLYLQGAAGHFNRAVVLAAHFLSRPLHGALTHIYGQRGGLGGRLLTMPGVGYRVAARRGSRLTKEEKGQGRDAKSDCFHACPFKRVKDRWYLRNDFLW